MTAIVYVCTNPAMPDYVKIGMTSKADVEQRLKELSNSTSVPMPFECLHAAEVDDAAKVEDALHKAFDDYRPNKKREFFTIDPQKVIVLLKAIQISDATPATEEILDRITSPEDKAAQIIAIAKSQEHRGRFNFSESDIPLGAELVFMQDETKKCRVVDDKQVEYEEVIFPSLTALARKLLNEIGKQLTTGGPWEFAYEGTRVFFHSKPDKGKVDNWKVKGWAEIVKSISNENPVKEQLQSHCPPTKESVDDLRAILAPKTFHPAKRAALLELLDALETQD